MQEKLNIIQWNCKSIHAPGRLSELRVLMDSKKPHIACISETWLTVNKNPVNIKGYKTFRKDRPRGHAGGLLFLIREDVGFNHFNIDNISNILEAQAIVISLGRDDVKLLHVYNPVNRLVIQHFDHLVQQLGRKFIVVGDLNGHHTMWDPDLRLDRINQCGRELANYLLDNQNLALITRPGLKTYTHTTHQSSNSSTLDLTLGSINLINISDTKLLGDSGSDHDPVLTTVSLKPDKILRNRRPKWKIKDNKWKLWKDNVPAQQVAPTSLEEEAKNFGEMLTKAANTAFGKTKGHQKSKFSKPWWSAECAKVVAQRRRAKKCMERRPIPANVIEFRRLSAKARRVIKNAKRESWRKFCKGLSADTPTGQVWKVIRSMSGKGKSSSSDIPIEVNGTLLTSASAKANILASRLEQLVGVDSPEIAPEEKHAIQQAKDTTPEDQFNGRFTIEELRNNIKDLPGDKATGADEVHNKFLKNLPDHSMRELLGLINRSWRRGEVPSSWKHSLVIPILKSGKMASDPNSYRPVSLISSVSKIMEKMVAGRLYWQLEKDEKFKKYQSGFRKGRATEDLLLKVEHVVRASLVNQRVTIAIFFDLKQAFDNVNHNLLLFKLAKAGICGRMISWIEQLLKDRTFQYIVDNSLSVPKKAKRGLPQGSILSPTLFNVMMCDLPQLENVEVIDFADDIAFTATAKTIEEATTLAERAVRSLENWSRRWQLAINPLKSKAMCFTLQRVLDRLPDFSIENSPIEWVRSFAYLGVTLDAPSLTWQKHIEDISREANQRLNIMRALAGSNWGADRELMLNIYVTYIRPKLLYGISAVASTSQTYWDKLERLQNAALRIAIGAKNTSPIKALQAEANIVPLDQYIRGICCKTYFRMSSHNHPILQNLEDDEDVNDRVWTRIFKPPFVIRCNQILTSLELPPETEVEEVLLPSRPPWEKPTLKLEWELSQPVTKDQSVEEVKAIALHTISTKYANHLRIYTDGSKVEESTSAAMWIPSMEIGESWKLNHGRSRSIMGAELFAISRALHWLVLNQPLLPNTKVVVLSDSMSGIMAVKNTTKRSYSYLTNQIRNLANLLEAELTLQFIPSHVGIEGNEHVDQLAKAAHGSPETIPIPLDKKEIKRLIDERTQHICQLQYETARQRNGRILHIAEIKSKLEHWPWTSSTNRRTETAMARLRIGHSKLRECLHRFDQAPDPDCGVCGVPETPAHILETCQKFTAERAIMCQSLRKAGVHATNIKTLLGGGKCDAKTQEAIRTAVEVFLTSSGAIDLI